MDEHRLLEVALVEVLRAVGHDRDRKFQTLGFMDGQDAHRAAGRLRAYGLEILAVLLHAAQQVHEAEKSAEALFLEGARPLEERKQVAFALCAAGQRPV